jgi:hypothetical protein
MQDPNDLVTLDLIDSMMYRNKKLLEVVRESPCQHCGIEDGTVVAAHSNQLIDGKGRGLKAHDYRIAALCFTCHAELDQGKDMSKAERVNMWEAAHRRTIGWLFDNDHLSVK